MSPSRGPTAEDLAQVLDRLRPRIARLFERHGVSEPAAEASLREALLGLAYSWGRVRDREQWLLQALTREAERHAAGSSKEPEDE